MQKPHKSDYAITVGDGAVSVRKIGSTKIRTAMILGQEDKGEGRSMIWLDRLIVPDGTLIEGGWAASGSVSTILTYDPARVEAC